MFQCCSPDKTNHTIVQKDSYEYEADDTDGLSFGLDDHHLPEHAEVKQMGGCEIMCNLLQHQGPSCGCCPCCTSEAQAEIVDIDCEGVQRSTQFMCSGLRIVTEQQLTLQRLKMSTLDVEEREEKMLRVNRQCAQEALTLIKELKGYYIKAAQTMTGAGQLPVEMEEAFAELLDQCPKENISVVREIVEKELGCRMEAVFKEFESEAIAAASIGQVHFATLIDGTKVAVKVQYPEVEKYFRIDIKMVSLAMRLTGMGAKVKKVFEVMQSQFAQEFDYTKEAAVMREVAQNILPIYRESVAIPLPIDAEHPACSRLSIPNVQTLCTRKVLTMERLEGTPIRERTMELVEVFAQLFGTTAEELKKQMNVKDPSKLDINNPAVKAAMNMGEVSENQGRMLRTTVRIRNTVVSILGCFMGCCCSEAEKPRWVKKQLKAPLNGPKLSRLLYDVHGHEIFQNGLFNSDPHAGNIFLLNDGKLGLIDYGACMRLSEEQRTCIAKLFVAIADEDDDAVPEYFWACGFKSKNNDTRLALLLAHMFFNRGPYPYDMNRLAPKIGMPQNPSLFTLDQYTRGGKLDEIEEFPGHLVMLQRCAMVLSGIGMELGAGRISSAGALKPQAVKWLEKQEAKRLEQFSARNRLTRFATRIVSRAKRSDPSHSRTTIASGGINESNQPRHKTEKSNLPLNKSANTTTESAVWKFNVDEAKWASADCEVIQQCKFSFDAKGPEVRMLPEEVANKIYKKMLGAKTMWCHNICVYKGVTGVATVLAEEHGLTFSTADAIWDFLVAEKPPQAGCCRKCVGRFAGSLSSSVLTCIGGLAEHDHDNTCNAQTCLFIKSGLQCPIHQMTPWALKEPEFQTARRPKSFPPNFSGF